MGERCETCRWFSQRTVMVQALGGEPQPTSMKIRTCNIRSVAGPFPQREVDDWCGEWEPVKRRDSFDEAAVRNVTAFARQTAANLGGGDDQP